MEGLPNPLAKIGALEERRDVAISFVGSLLQLRIGLTQSFQFIVAVLNGRSTRCSDQGLQSAMNNQVRVTPDWRCEVRVVRERQAEVADIRRLVHGLRHCSHNQRLDERSRF